MSKHKTQKPSTTEEEVKVVVEQKPKKEKKEKEPLTKGEKIFTIVVTSVALVAILLIVILSIVNKENEFSELYEGLEEDNVYETITYNEIIKKLDRQEEFYLVVANSNYTSNQTNASEIMVSMNKIAKENDLSKIYYIEITRLTDLQQYELYYKRGGELNRDVFNVPCLMYFANFEDNYTAKEVSGQYSVDKYLLGNDNYSEKWDALFADYFLACKR